MGSRPRQGKPKPKKSPRLGRPPVADADRRETLVRVLVTEDEHAELQRFADTTGMRLGTWLRAIALERARAGTR